MTDEMGIAKIFARILLLVHRKPMTDILGLLAHTLTYGGVLEVIENVA